MVAQNVEGRVFSRGVAFLGTGFRLVSIGPLKHILIGGSILPQKLLWLGYIVWFLITVRWLPSALSFFSLQWANLIDPSPTKKLKTMEAPQNKKVLILQYGVPPFWPTYIVERRTTFVEAYAIKVWCFWECFGECIGNLGKILETWWNLLGTCGNIVRTHWEQSEKWNPPPSTPLPCTFWQWFPSKW